MPERLSVQPLTANRPPFTDNATGSVSTNHEQSTINESSLAYNVRLDFQAYQNLGSQKGTLSEIEYRTQLENLTELTKTNIITSIGERLNVELFRAQYQQVGNKLFSPLYQEPFLEVVKKGQEFREQKGSHDVKREKAEVAGFTKAQELLADPNLGRDAKIIIISPRGNDNSIYQHNFYDVYEKAADGKINMSRYSQKNSYQQLWQVAQEVDPFSGIPENAQDHDFLQNPLVTYKTKKNIQGLFNPDTKTTSVEEFARVTSSTHFKDQIQAYFQALTNGESPETLQHGYNLIATTADIFSGLDTQSSGGSFEAHLHSPLRIVKTDCVSSGSTSNPYSVSEFGSSSFILKDQYGTLEIKCQECHTTYLRTSGKLEENCRFCGGTKGIVC